MARFTQPGGSGGGVQLPQGLGTSASPTFDKVYTDHQGDGTNFSVGDDVWIGDVNTANFMSVKGQQDATLGGIIFGSNLTETIDSDGNNLTLNANGDIHMFTNNGDLVLSPNNEAYLWDSSDPGLRIATISDIPTVTPMAYGAFHDENSFGPYAANAEHALSYESTDISSNVHIGGINNSEIVMDVAGRFNIQFSTQFHATSGGAIVYVWLKKNGTSIPWSNTRVDITANNPYAVLAWNWFVDAAQYDAFEIFWSSPSNNVKVEALTGLTGTKPNVPSNIVTVNQVG